MRALLGDSSLTDMKCFLISWKHIEFQCATFLWKLNELLHYDSVNYFSYLLYDRWNEPMSWTTWFKFHF